MAINPFAKFTTGPDDEEAGANPFAQFAVAPTPEAIPEAIPEERSNVGVLADRATTVIAQQGGGLLEMSANQEGMTPANIADAVVPPEEGPFGLPGWLSPSYNPVLDLATEAGGQVVKEAVDLADQVIDGDVRKAMQETGRMLRSEANAELSAPENQYDAEGIEKYLYEVAEATVGMVIPLATGALTKSPTAAMALLSAQVAGNTYASTMEKTDGDHGKSMAAAKFSLIAEALPEALPVTAALRKAGAGDAVARLLETTLGEGAQEMITEILTSVYDAKELEGMTMKEALMNIDWSQVAHAGLIGLGVGTAIGTPGTIADFAAEKAAINSDPDKAPSAEDQAAKIVEEATPGDIAPPVDAAPPVDVAPVEGMTPIDGTIMPDPRDAPTPEDVTDMDLDLNQYVVDDMIAEEEAAALVPDVDVLPESDETINAQLEVMDDPATDRKAVYLAPGQPEPAIDPDKHRVIELGDGGMAVVPATYEGAQTAQTLSAATQMDEATKQAAIADATGIGGQGKTPGAPAVVVTDPDGTVVQSAVADPAGEVLAAAEAVAETRDAEVSVVDPQEVIAERVGGTDLEAGLAAEPLTDLEAGLDETLDETLGFQEATANTTGPLRSAVDSVSSALAAHELERAPTGKAGRLPVGNDAQQQGADAAWSGLVLNLPKLIEQGYDVTALKSILRKVAGNRSPTMATASDRSGRPISGRIPRGEGKTNKTPPGGWEKTLGDFYTGAQAELSRFATEGPTVKPEDILGTDAYKNKKREQRNAKQREKRAAIKAKLEGKMVNPPVAKVEPVVEPVVEPAIDMDLDIVVDPEIAAADLDTAANEAATSPNNDIPLPTEAQIEANDGEGNYKKGHYRWGGLPITIENPAGSKRKPEWPPLTNHYGDWDGTLGADGDKIDGFFGPLENGKVFIVNQVTADGKFDEHKTITGLAETVEEATQIYKDNYSKGFRVGPVIEATVEEFKAWLQDGDTTKPFVVDAPAAKAVKATAKKKAADAEAKKAARIEKLNKGSKALKKAMAKPAFTATKSATEVTQEEKDIVGEGDVLINEQTGEEEASPEEMGHVQLIPKNKKQERDIEKYEERILNTPEEEAEILMKRQQEEAFNAAKEGAKEDALQAKMAEIRAALDIRAAEQEKAIKQAAKQAAGAKPVVKTKGKRKIAMMGKEALGITSGPTSSKKVGKLSIKRAQQNMERLHEYALTAADNALSKFRKNREAISQGRDSATDMMDFVLTEFKDDQVSVISMLNNIYEELHPADPYRVLIDRMREVGVPDIEVVMMTDPEVTDIAGPTTAGAHVTFKKGDGYTSAIIMNEDAMLSSFGVKTFMHEMMHAYTSQALRTNNATALKLEALRKRVINVLEAEGGDFAAQDYGFTNVDEFVAEAMTNAEFQKVLNSVKIGNGQSLWTKFIDIVSNMLGIPVDQRSALAEVMTLSSDLMMTPSEIQQSYMDTATPFITKKEGELDADASVEELYSMMQGDRSVRVLQNKGVRDAVGRIVAVATNKANTVQDKAFGRETQGPLDFTKEKWQHGKLWVSTMDQIIRNHAPKFKTATGNLLKNLQKVQRKKTQIARELQQKAERIDRAWRDFEKTNPIKQVRALSQLMQDTTLSDVNPDVTFWHAANKHLWQNKTQQQIRANEAKHLAARDRFNSLAPGGRVLYRDVKDFYKTQRIDMRQATVNRLVETNKLDKTLSAQDVATIRNATEPADIANVDFTPLQDIADDIKQSLETVLFATTVKGPYFPLRRYGNYAVDAVKTSTGPLMANRKEAQKAAAKLRAKHPLDKIKTKKNGASWNVVRDERIFEKHETLKAANRVSKALTAQGYMNRGSSGPVMTTVMNDPQHVEGSGSGVLLQKAKGKLGEGSAEFKALETSFTEMLLANSLQKAELKRNKVKGASLDMRRGFAERAFAGSWALADLKTSFEQAEAMAALRKHAKHDAEDRITAGNVVRELSIRNDNHMAERKTHAFDAYASKFGFVWYLMSPSYTAVNLTQPWLVATPYFAGKYGAVKATKALAAAYKDISSVAAKEVWDAKFGVAHGPDNMLDLALASVKGTEVGDMLQEMTDQGIIDATFMQELYEASQGKTDVAYVSATKNKIMDIARTMPQIAEVLNRVTVAKAGYALEREAGGTHEEAVEAAGEAILQTQFNYADENKPRAFKGVPGIKSIMMFKMYGQGMYALLASNTVKAYKGGTQGQRKEGVVTLVGLLASHSMAAGVLGGVMIEPIRAILWAINELTNEDDEEWDINAEVEMFLNDMLGSFFGNAVARGIPAALGVGGGSRVSMEHMLVLGLNDTRNKSEGLIELLVKLGGPIPAAGLSMARGLDYFSQGDYMKGAEAMVPKGIRDPLRGAVRYPLYGLTDSRNREIPVDLNIMDFTSQFLGVTPPKIEEYYEHSNAIKNHEKRIEDKKKKLIYEWLNADNNVEFYFNEIESFNDRNDPKWEIQQSDYDNAEKSAFDKEDEMEWGTDNQSMTEEDMRDRLGL